MSNLARELEEKMAHGAERIQEAQIVSNGVTSSAHGAMSTEQVSKIIHDRNNETIRSRHEKSLNKYPNVSVDDDEYVVVSLARHPIGVYEIIAGAAAIFVILASLWILICLTPNSLSLTAMMKNNLSIIFVLLMIFTVIAGVLGSSVYSSNKMVITNERAIQWVADSLFHKHRQVISLKAVEDISFTQKGVLAHMLNYGTVRLSTVGEESTYTFHIAARPAKLAEIIDEICEAAKNDEVLDEKTYLDGQRFSR